MIVIESRDTLKSKEDWNDLQDHRWLNLTHNFSEFSEYILEDNPIIFKYVLALANPSISR